MNSSGCQSGGGGFGQNSLRFDTQSLGDERDCGFLVVGGKSALNNPFWGPGSKAIYICCLEQAYE